MAKPPISFLAFFLLWAENRGWDVPDIHVRACHWLQHRGSLAVFRCFRGFGKSTLLAVYNAWRFYCGYTHRILHQGESDGTAYKTSRDTQNVLRKHPLTAGLLLPSGKVSVEQWWVNGAADVDARNASMFAKGIMSNVTSARADECQNDDVEVPRNIATPEAREKLRYRLTEQTHILVPGGSVLYVGTPHTHDSLYDEQEALGADCLTIQLFAREFRIESAKVRRVSLPFAPEFVFGGIGKEARLLVQGTDYRLEGRTLVLSAATGELLDCYAGCSWPERFTADDLLKRRRKTRTLNEWDSQYQLHSKPVGLVRLDPARIIPYDAQPVIEQGNGEIGMWLGATRIVSASFRWDPASGNVHRDVSAYALVLQDAGGRRYLHHVGALTGEVAEFADDGKTIVGGQVFELCDVIERFQLPRIKIENNGVGQFAPAVLRAALRQRSLQCAVVAEPSTTNKNRRILETLEPLLLSRGMLWAHVDVLNGPLWDQMRDWNPGVTDQPDDYIDVSAAAVADTPERMGRIVGKSNEVMRQDWSPQAGACEVVFER